MNKILFFLLLIPLLSNSQVSSGKKPIKGKYMSLNLYKKKFGKNLTKIDSLSFIITKNDTLVKLPDNFDYYDKAVRVPYEYKDAIFLEIYEDVVYKKNHRNKKNINKIRMRLWKDDLRIFFTASVNDNTKNELTSFINNLSKNIDSLNITYVDQLEESNYLIYELNSKHTYSYEPRLKKNLTDYYLFWNKGKLNNCRLQIFNNNNLSDNEHILKVKKTFFQSLGRFYSSQLVSNKSILYPTINDKTQLTDLDLEILKYHYSYGICKFTTLETFEGQHKKAKLLLEKGETLNFLHKY